MSQFRKKTEHPAPACGPRGTSVGVASLLAYIAEVSHRVETKLVKRFPEWELSRLIVAGHVEFHSLSPRAWRVTAAGRAALKAERDSRGMRHAS